MSKTLNILFFIKYNMLKKDLDSFVKRTKHDKNVKSHTEHKLS